MARLVFAGSKRGAEWTSAAGWRVFVTSLSWGFFFVLVACVEMLVAAIQRRMSNVLWLDAVPVLALGLSHWSEAALACAVWRSHGPPPSSGAAPTMAPIRTNVFLPGLVRHVLGRFCVLLLGPLVLVVWASQVQEKTYNLVVDGFVGCVLAAHVGRFVWEVVLSQCCALKSLRGSAGSELLRVVTFNVNKCARAGEGWDLNIVVDAVTRNGRPHIVALQNVHHDDSGGDSMLAELAAALRMDYRFSPCEPGSNVGHAVLVTVEWEITHHETIHLDAWRQRSSTRWGRQERTAALAVNLRPAGTSPARATPITVVSTLFGSDFSGVEQVQSMSELCRTLRLRCLSQSGRRRASPGASLVDRLVLPTKLIVCGDFAASASGLPLLLADELGLTDTASAGWSGRLAWGCGGSSSHSLLVPRPDRILVAASGPLRVRKTYVVKKPSPALHSPVVAELNLVTRTPV